MGSDLTFNIAAIDRASETFVKLAGTVDNLADRVEALDRKSADPKIDVDTSEADRKLDELNRKVSGIGNVDIGKGALIGAAGLAASGAAVAGGLLAIPAAIAAIGIESEKTNPEVQQSFRDLTDTAKQTAQEGFLPLVPSIVGFASEAKGALGIVKGALADDAAAAAPLIDIIGDSFIKAAEQGIGGSVPIIQSLRPAAQAAGDDIVKIEQGLVGFLGNLHVDDASQGLQALGDDFKQIVPEVGNLLSDAIPLGNALGTVLGPAITNTVRAAEGAAPVLNAMGSAISFLGPDIATYTPPALAALGVTKLLTGSYTDFGGAIGKVKPLVTDTGNVMTSLGQKIGITTAATNQAKAAEAAEAVVRAELTKAAKEEALAEAEAAFAQDGSRKSALAVAEAQDAVRAASIGAADAEKVLATSSEAATFSFGPLGIALGAAALLAVPFITNTDKAASSAEDLTADIVKLAQAAPSASAGLVSGNQSLANLIDKAQKAGVNVTGLLSAYRGGPAALQSFQNSLKKQNDTLGNTQTQYVDTRESLAELDQQIGGNSAAYDDLDPKLKGQLQNYRDQKDILTQLGISVGDLTSQQNAAAAVLTKSTAGQQQEADIAKVLGISLDTVTSSYQNLAAGTSFAMSATAQASDTFLGQVLAVDTANSTISNYFKQSDQGVKQASASLADAQHSATQASDAVTDARHSFAQSEQAVATAEQGVVTAQRAVTDATTGVATAQDNVTKARNAARTAQLGLTAAEAAATEQLKELHLQLTSQVTSEESARVSLFDQQTSAAALGVTSTNAQSVASQKVTASNEDRVKAAISLLQAEESLNSTLNTGTNLRGQVSAADKAGVAGSQQVMAAQQAIADAQAQVISSEQALVKAHQAVTDAQAGVLKAQQGVTEASSNEAKAWDAVTQAQYANKKASDAVTQAKDALKTAQDDASRSTDIHTAAGQRNIGMLKQVAEQLDANEKPQQAANDLVKDTAKLFDGSTDAASDFLKKINLIPKNFKFSMTGVATADLTQLQRTYQSIVSSGRRATPSSGLITPFATGGQIFGPGGPRDDKIPAMLSNREFVQPVDSVDYYGVDFMEAVRQKKLPRFFASGGLAEADATALDLGGVGAAYQTAANAIGVMGFPAPKSLPVFVAPVLGAFSATTGLSGNRSANAKLMQKVFAGYGWGSGAEWSAMQYLMARESGFDNFAQNPTSTAFGQFQFLNSTWAGYGIPKTSDPELQDVAGARYIGARYGDPLHAAQHEVAFNWYRDGGMVALKPPKSYDSGGWLGPNDTGRNQLGRPEAVLTPDESAAFVKLAKSIGSGGGGTPVEIHVHTAQGASTDEIATEVMRRLQFHGRG